MREIKIKYSVLGTETFFDKMQRVSRCVVNYKKWKVGEAPDKEGNDKEPSSKSR